MKHVVNETSRSTKKGVEAEWEHPPLAEMKQEARIKAEMLHDLRMQMTGLQTTWEEINVEYTLLEEQIYVVENPDKVIALCSNCEEPLTYRQEIWGITRVEDGERVDTYMHNGKGHPCTRRHVVDMDYKRRTDWR